MDGILNTLFNPEGLIIIETLVTILKFLIPIVLIVMLIRMNWNVYFEGVARKTEDRISKRLKQREGYFNFDRITDYLRRKGIEYSMGEYATPFVFLIVKLLFALIVVMLVVAIANTFSNISFGIMAFIILISVCGGFFVPDLIIYFLNEMDNEEMLMDIKSIFDTLKIQTKSGVYLTYSLCECYMIVENPRLKQALLDMTSQIIAKNQIDEAVMEFNSKFENSYIDTLCITILQSMESGKSTQILDDLAKQISDMQRAINIKEQEALDRRVQFFEMLIFAGVLVGLVYVLGTSVMGSLTTF